MFNEFRICASERARKHNVYEGIRFGQSVAAQLADGTVGGPDAVGARPSGSSDLLERVGARSMRAKTLREPEVVSRGTFSNRDKTDQFRKPGEVSAGARRSSQVEAGTAVPRGQASGQLRLQ